MWNNGNYEPSDRWLDGVCAVEQWRKNETITTISSNGKKFSMPAKEYIDICDSHFESRVTYNTAMRLVNLINKENTKDE